ncbi:MAG: DUF1934 domain-containing protein [Lachnospiraceae bacterium]|nr:DUF1934 domain-containing protein [Lachnospiraceae bacterium]
MTKDIILTISGLHATDGDSDAPIETMTPAQYYFKNGKHYVVYDEMIEGLEGAVKSTIKFTENQVELLRSGMASTRMVFQPGHENMVIYQTPMGPLSISLYTEEIVSEIGEERIKLEIEYSLKTEGIVVSESTVNIEVFPKELLKF